VTVWQERTSVCDGSPADRTPARRTSPPRRRSWPKSTPKLTAVVGKVYFHHLATTPKFLPRTIDFAAKPDTIHAFRLATASPVAPQGTLNPGIVTKCDAFPRAVNETRAVGASPALSAGHKLPRPVFFYGRQQTSDLRPRASGIQHPTSNIQHRASSFEHPASSIQHPANPRPATAGPPGPGGLAPGLHPS
jgi:hypothetical protein